MTPDSGRSAGSHNLLEIRNLRAGYGQAPVLDRLCLSVAAGEVVGLLGLNGSGKSTLFRVISGHVAPLGGSVVWLEHSLEVLSPWHRRKAGICQLLQTDAVFRDLSVIENLQLASSLGGSKGRFSEVLDSGLVDRAQLGRMAGNLSGGQQRRLALSMCLLQAPSGEDGEQKPFLLLLDEPVAGIDVEAQHIVVRAIQGLPARKNTAIIVIEHNIELLCSLCNRIEVLSGGYISSSFDQPFAAESIHAALFDLGDTPQL